MFVEDPVCNIMCEEIKALISGCDTIMDATYFGDQYANKYPKLKFLIYSIIKGQLYPDNIDIKTKQDILRDVYSSSYDDAEKMITILNSKSNDDIYKRTLNRIAKQKRQPRVDIKRIVQQGSYKTCPHCENVMCAKNDANYVICGYNDTKLGYDWRGCGCDWCFKCGKMLCKKWHTDSLHCVINRIHTAECCKKHAIENDGTYPDDYCQCDNNYVCRYADIDLIDIIPKN